MREAKHIKEYKRRIEWNKLQKNPIDPMTSSQYEFAVWLFKSKGEIELSKIGDVFKIFQSIYTYSREVIRPEQ